MSKIILRDKQCKERMMEGIKEMYEMVSMTLGPGGKNVALVDGFGNLRVTKDGVSVAKAVKFDDPVMEAGAKLIREAAQKTCDDSGDGTTTTTILAYKIISEGLKIMSGGNIKPFEFRNKLVAACNKAVDYMKDMVLPCDSEERIHQIAMISSNGDSAISDLVTEAIVKATKDGAISIETSQSGYSYVEIITGMRFEKGLESDYFINDSSLKSCTFEAPNIVVIRGKVDNMKEFVKILEPVIEIGRPVLFMADDFSMDIINALALNKVQNGFKLCAVKLPSFGDQRDAMVEDICTLIGCEPIGTPKYSYDNFNVDIHVGSCERTVVDKHYTTIAGGDGNEIDITNRIQLIRNEIEHNDNSDEVARLRERLVKLSGGLAIIHVGAASDTETGEIKDRVDDAVCAVRSALEEGIVPGAGKAYIHANNNLIDECNTKDEGVSVLVSVLDSISDRIITNSGISVSENNTYYNNEGVNAATGEYVDDLIEAGIIDPFKSVRVALQNAVSVACMFLTTEGCVIEVPDK